MDNRINEIRRIIRALRVSMREAESIMHEQINRDEDCTFVAEEILKMRTAMAGLAQERASLGDTDPIVVASLFIPRRAPASPRPHPIKRRLVPPGSGLRQLAR
ncbi:hypothetical protein AC629_39875 [Bradyrhizobium sp. NAS80.1]|uniref:hypothetical protein n=1 Tax=Bradyrhizobium sp. NAS80.1 TaxID=1680159 RepID=UPI0009601D44|nr:hypothetical protein [Bradyrhizobium sp. NAS80.1]OKO70890.1 hypothetical protein AC629_39875 [Bradyrhizobium sp. NAS80.1]